MNKVKYTEWIDSYLDNDLDETGMRIFKEELKENPQLALEYRLEADLNKILQDETSLDFRAKCLEAQREVNLEQKQSVKVVHFIRKYWYAAASLVLIALIVGGIFLMNPQGYSNERLFKMYYKSGESISVTRSGNVNMVEALISFSKKDYATAANSFEKILANEPENFAVMYYCGIANIENHNYSKSVELFQNIINNGDNLYIEYAQWYLGLTYLIANEKNKALTQFESIASDSGNYYQNQAQSILEKIRFNEKGKKIINNLFFLILPF